MSGPTVSTASAANSVNCRLSSLRGSRNSLDVELVKAESLRAMRERPDNPDAADLAMRGWAHIFYSNQSDLDEPISLFERALALDPQNVPRDDRPANALVLARDGLFERRPSERHRARGEN